MADKITDYKKALSRYQASDKILGADSKVTITFAKRAKELGHDIHDNALTTSNEKAQKLAIHNKTLVLKSQAEKIVKTINSKVPISYSFSELEYNFHSYGIKVNVAPKNGTNSNFIHGHLNYGDIMSVKPSVLGNEITQIRNICKRLNLNLYIGYRGLYIWLPESK